MSCDKQSTCHQKKCNKEQDASATFCAEWEELCSQYIASFRFGFLPRLMRQHINSVVNSSNVEREIQALEALEAFSAFQDSLPLSGSVGSWYGHEDYVWALSRAHLLLLSKMESVREKMSHALQFGLAVRESPQWNQLKGRLGAYFLIELELERGQEILKSIHEKKMITEEERSLLLCHRSRVQDTLVELKRRQGNESESEEMELP